MTTHVEADCRLDVDAGSIPVASTIFIIFIICIVLGCFVFDALTDSEHYS